MHRPGHIDHYIDPNGILFTRVSGDVEESMLDELRQFVHDQAHEVRVLDTAMGPKLRGIMDLSKIRAYHPDTLKIMIDYCIEVKDYFEKAATFGATGLVAQAQKYVLGKARWNNVRSFETEAEAVAWVREPDTALTNS